EREYVARLKRLAIALLGHASATYGDGLKEEQEVLARIADIVIETYATESALARAEKMAARGDGRASLATDIAQAYTNEAADGVGLPLGRLSDKIQRRKILAAGVFAWSLLTAAFGVARSFAQLIVARLGVGVGEATCSPASTSLIGDLFPATMRERAIAIWMLGLPLGLGLANGAGGW